MKPLLLTLTLTLLAAGCRPAAPRPAPTPSPAATPVAPPTGDAFAAAARLGRGVNLGNALEAPTEGEWGVTLQETDFQIIKDGGFDAVRIPIRWSAHAGDTAPYTIDAAFFARIDWAVNAALSRGLAAIVNVHHYDDAVLRPKQHEARFLALWRQIAARYRDYPAGLYFEVFNEPHDISDRTWNDMQNKAIAAIRETNPDRYLIVGPVDWFSHRRLNDLKLPEQDRKLIVTFHYYLPFQFTHQGAEWVSDSDAWMGTTWTATTAQAGDVDWDLDVAAAWGKANNRPIFLGEFGAYSKADMASRARWTAYVARQAEARGMAWAYWEFRSGFGVYDGAQQTWNEPIHRALIP